MVLNRGGSNMGKLLEIEICMGTSCHLLGAQDLMEVIETLPAEKKAMVELKGAICLESCGKGPNIKVNGLVLCNMTPERLLQIIDDNLQ
jgi:NADH:ubiquinone oxidoreductase subunit E